MCRGPGKGAGQEGETEKVSVEGAERERGAVGRKR